MIVDESKLHNYLYEQKEQLKKETERLSGEIMKDPDNKDLIAQFNEARGREMAYSDLYDKILRDYFYTSPDIHHLV